MPELLLAHGGDLLGFLGLPQAFTTYPLYSCFLVAPSVLILVLRDPFTMQGYRATNDKEKNELY